MGTVGCDAWCQSVDQLGCSCTDRDHHDDDRQAHETEHRLEGRELHPPDHHPHREPTSGIQSR